jgi:hypothetical protein
LPPADVGAVIASLAMMKAEQLEVEIAKAQAEFDKARGWLSALVNLRKSLAWRDGSRAHRSPRKKQSAEAGTNKNQLPAPSPAAAGNLLELIRKRLRVQQPVSIGVIAGDLHREPQEIRAVLQESDEFDATNGLWRLRK